MPPAASRLRRLPFQPKRRLSPPGSLALDSVYEIDQDLEPGPVRGGGQPQSTIQCRERVLVEPNPSQRLPFALPGLTGSGVDPGSALQAG